MKVKVNFIFSITGERMIGVCDKDKYTKTSYGTMVKVHTYRGDMMIEKSKLNIVYND